MNISEEEFLKKDKELMEELESLSRKEKDVFVDGAFNSPFLAGVLTRHS